MIEVGPEVVKASTEANIALLIGVINSLVWIIGLLITKVFPMAKKRNGNTLGDNPGRVSVEQTKDWIAAALAACRQACQEKRLEERHTWDVRLGDLDRKMDRVELNLYQEIQNLEQRVSSVERNS